MLKEIKGDLLTCGANLLCHQVNYAGVMGGGIAADIRSKALGWVSYRAYRDYCKQWGWQTLGTIQILPYRNHAGQFIVNVFSQNEYPLFGEALTDYPAMRRALAQVERIARERGLSVALPGYIGCGIAGGNWNTVRGIITDVFKSSSVDCTIVYWDQES